MRWTPLLAGLATATMLGCSGDDGPSEPNDGGNPTVSVQNNEFVPPTIEIAAGNTVTWEWNSGGTSHNVTFEDGQSSPTQGSGQYSRTFAAAGTYPYRCTIHPPTMTGTVTVTGGSSGGTGGGGGGGTGGGGGGGGYGSRVP